MSVELTRDQQAVVDNEGGSLLVSAAAGYGLCRRRGTEPPGCQCGSVIRGLLRPEQCPLFGKVCRPEDPVGPCMVSGEGACAAAWKYRPADA